MEERQEHHERREMNLRMAEDIGYIKATLDSLAGSEGRITKIEKNLEWQDRKGWIQTVIVIPFLGGLHALAHHFGWKV